MVSGIWSPGYTLFEPKTFWTQTQAWARNNTPRDAMFITPPEILSRYIPNWRTFSDRGMLAALVEIKVRYLVIVKPHLQPFPVVYENDDFAVYDLQSVASSNN